MGVLRKQNGAIAVMTGLLLPLMLVFTGIAVDIGRLYVEKAKLQNLADSAVTAALVEIRKTKPDFYVANSGVMRQTIPIGAISYNTSDEKSIKDDGDNAANIYLGKNIDAGTYNIPGLDVQTHIYATKSSEMDGDVMNYRYYYEVILGKEFPVYFARFVHPDDILVRAGAVCSIDIRDTTGLTTYLEALAKWGKLTKEQLKEINVKYRNKVDQEALANLGRYFIGQSLDFVKQELGNPSGYNNLLIGRYNDISDVQGVVATLYTYGDNNISKTLQEKTIHWMQGDYGNWVGNYDSSITFNNDQRYLFSDYAIEKTGIQSSNGKYEKGGIKLTLKIENDVVTKVQVKIDPLSSQEGSDVLQSTVTLN